jgi:hypothetical protein
MGCDAPYNCDVVQSVHPRDRLKKGAAPVHDKFALLILTAAQAAAGAAQRTAGPVSQGSALEVKSQMAALAAPRQTEA